ncbi:MAG TPA: tetratricopeptide repeat protein, partial [Blastocatellia bacterium]|nr:tetratricopeptide repeat protein [Blastocatellia bacterium]
MSSDEAEDFLQRLINQTQDPDIYAELDRTRLIQTAEANPLIIEWIVGQIDLANDPEQVLDELSHGEGDAAHRVFDRSFNLRQMADGGRAVLLALSLFTPSATRSALAKVAGMGKDKDKKRFKKAQETLASLWLIKKTEAGQRLSVAGLTRELTRARLSVDLRNKSFRQRFTAQFLKYAEANRNPTPEHLNALEEEKDNILSAMDVALELDDWSSVLRLSDSIKELLMMHGYWDEAIRCGEQALKAAHNLQDQAAFSSFANNTAITFQERGELEKAQRLYKESLEIARMRGDQRGIAVTLHNLAIIAQGQGELEEAHRLYSESLAIKKRLVDQSGIAATLQGLGVLMQDQGQVEEARRLFDESFEIAARLGTQKGVATTLRALGKLVQEQGELDEAWRLYDESLEISKRLGNQKGIAASLHQLGIVCLERRNLKESENLLNQSLLILRKLSHK